MHGFKGFDRNMQCRGFQYESGKEYETDSAKLCISGFHFCENPIDVFGYYAPIDSRYCEVDAGDVTDETKNDSKRCSKKIRIGAEIGIKGIVDAFVRFTLERITSIAQVSNTGDYSAAANTGCRSAAAVNGGNSVACALGYDSRAKGALGCGICVAERDSDGKLIAIKAAIIDGEILEADTFYKLVGGDFVKDIERDDDNA